MPGLGESSDKGSLSVFAGKESSLQTSNYTKGRNQRRNNTNDSFGKGFHVAKRSRAKLFNDWALPPTSLQLRPKFH